MVDDDDDDREALLGDGNGGQRSAKYNFWSLEFYSQWFDVDQGEKTADRIEIRWLTLT